MPVSSELGYEYVGEVANDENLSDTQCLTIQNATYDYDYSLPLQDQFTLTAELHNSCTRTINSPSTGAYTTDHWGLESWGSGVNITDGELNSRPSIEGNSSYQVTWNVKVDLSSGWEEGMILQFLLYPFIENCQDNCEPSDLSNGFLSVPLGEVNTAQCLRDLGNHSLQYDAGDTTINVTFQPWNLCHGTLSNASFSLQPVNQSSEWISVNYTGVEGLDDEIDLISDSPTSLSSIPLSWEVSIKEGAPDSTVIELVLTGGCDTLQIGTYIQNCTASEYWFDDVYATFQILNETDGDGWADTDELTCGTDPLDNVSVPLDTDSDRVCDVMDDDDDNDGVVDSYDMFPLDSVEWNDDDGDGVGDNTDDDDDNDGVLDWDDAFPLNEDEYIDTDRDGIGNNADDDDDDDGVADELDVYPLNPYLTDKLEECVFEGKQYEFDDKAEVVFYLRWGDDNGGQHCGTLQFELYDDVAPKTAQSFRGHVADGNYDGAIFHRVINDFVIQGGDFVSGDGTGGYAHDWYGYCNGLEMEQTDCPSTSEYTLPDEINENYNHVAGALSMAKFSAKDTGGSQFFIIDKGVEMPHLDGVHSVFGTVLTGTINGDGVGGIQVVEAISQVATSDRMDRPYVNVTILSAEIIEGSNGDSEKESDEAVPGFSGVLTLSALLVAGFIFQRREVI